MVCKIVGREPGGRIDQHHSKVATWQIEIAVFGRVSSGKSSLLDTILETDVLLERGMRGRGVEERLDVCECFVDILTGDPKSPLLMRVESAP